MLLFALLVLQTAPDIEVNVHATIREVRIRQRGEAVLEVHASPDAGSRVEAARPAANAREVNARNVNVNVHGEARIADPATNSPGAETTNPKPR